jgi:hypothetical protein
MKQCSQALTVHACGVAVVNFADLAATEVGSLIHVEPPAGAFNAANLDRMRYMFCHNAVLQRH